MRFYNGVYSEIVESYKLGKRQQEQLKMLINTSTDYWITTEKGKELIQKSITTRKQILHNAFSNYCYDTNQRDLTTKKLTKEEIQAMDQWVQDEYKKALPRLNKTKASETIVEGLTTNTWNEIL